MHAERIGKPRDPNKYAALTARAIDRGASLRRARVRRGLPRHGDAREINDVARLLEDGAAERGYRLKPFPCHDPVAQAHRPCLGTLAGARLSFEKRESPPQTRSAYLTSGRRVANMRRAVVAKGRPSRRMTSGRSVRAARSTAHRRCQAQWSEVRSRRPPVHGRGCLLNLARLSRRRVDQRTGVA
jgi:hypothetical protein